MLLSDETHAGRFLGLLRVVRRSTEVVEAGCKLVVDTRLKRAGMHRTIRRSNAIIALRWSRLSGRSQDFWERWADARKAE
jgi:hypothetical protein